jgi:hypothetical protein
VSQQARGRVEVGHRSGGGQHEGHDAPVPARGRRDGLALVRVTAAACETGRERRERSPVGRRHGEQSLCAVVVVEEGEPLGTGAKQAPGEGTQQGPAKKPGRVDTRKHGSSLAQLRLTRERRGRTAERHP